MEKYSDPNIFKSFNPSGEIIVGLAIALLLIILAIIVPMFEMYKVIK